MDINQIIDEAIEALVDGNIDNGADQLYELADCFARAGLPIEDFYNIRKYIVTEAIERTDEKFIIEKLKLAERRNRERRNQTKKANKITADNLRL